MHFDIVSLAIEHHDLLRAVDPATAAVPNAREEVYINLMVGYWLTTWQTGAITESQLRGLVRSMFDGEVGQEWWARVRNHWSDPRSRQKQRFCSILTEEWHRAKRE
ncbi:hypothetical protein Psuf_042940 [Phytohabitans suffuscus]|uniref:Uncharacterized protein n=2 Tax=Phytohabitans suffuscus TaxID=624315 RepID=A0A6F8YM10_9ACTN|nr:hypothetical protein Psuf_042940 [Phytohabitans suffuscus]